MTANERNRKKIRISIIDVLIVITVIACAVGAFLHYRIYEKNNEVIKDDVALVSVMLYNVENSISTKIAVIFAKNVFFCPFLGTKSLGFILFVTDGRQKDLAKPKNFIF